MADTEETTAPEDTNQEEGTSSSPAVDSDPSVPSTPIPSSSILKPRASPSEKVQVLLKPTGATPALKKQKWMVTRDKPIGGIGQFLKKNLGMEAEKTLFMYVKQTFSPTPDVEIGTLYDCFGSDGRLVLHYCMTEAWG